MSTKELEGLVQDRLLLKNLIHCAISEDFDAMREQKKNQRLWKLFELPTQYASWSVP